MSKQKVLLTQDKVCIGYIEGKFTSVGGNQHLVGKWLLLHRPSVRTNPVQGVPTPFQGVIGTRELDLSLVSWEAELNSGFMRMLEGAILEVLDVRTTSAVPPSTH